MCIENRIRKMDTDYHIRIIGSEENKDRAFELLMDSTFPLLCLTDEEYMTNDNEIIKALNKARIEYKQWGVQYD